MTNYTKYEVHYLNDLYEKRVYEFESFNAARKYIDMLAENAVYMYGFLTDGSEELLYKHEQPEVADGSYLKYDIVINSDKYKLLATITDAAFKFKKNFK